MRISRIPRLSDKDSWDRTRKTLSSQAKLDEAQLIVQVFVRETCMALTLLLVLGLHRGRDVTFLNGLLRAGPCVLDLSIAARRQHGKSE